MRVTHHGELVAEIPNKALTDDAPVYKRPVGEWKCPAPLDPPAWVLEELKKPRDYTADLKKLLASANICDKRWVFEQYDSMVQTNTVQGPGGEAGVMRIKGTGHHATYAIDPVETVMSSAIGLMLAPPPTMENLAAKPERGIAMALAGNGRWAWLDPKLGAMHAVAEAARKVACTGATPVAATNCLNFGNPEKPEIMAQLSAAIDGIAEACTALGTPVTGGNVSLYNETKGEGIYPTPVIGIVGLLDDVSKAVPDSFQDGQHLFVVSNAMSTQTYSQFVELGSSEYARRILGEFWGVPPAFSLTEEAALQKLIVLLASKGMIEAARDIDDGGLAVSLAEGCFRNNVGVQLRLNNSKLNAMSLFGEFSSSVILAMSPEDAKRVREQIEGAGFAIAAWGKVTGDSIAIDDYDDFWNSGSIPDLKAAHSSTLESQLATEVVTA